VVPWPATSAPGSTTEATFGAAQSRGRRSRSEMARTMATVVRAQVVVTTIFPVVRPASIAEWASTIWSKR
jgi:hypothetical protein